MQIVSYKKLPRVQKEKCTACGLCRTVCPHDCLGMIGGTGTLVRPDICTSEGDCAEACPNGAIRMHWRRLDGTSSIGQWRVRCAKTLRADSRATGSRRK